MKNSFVIIFAAIFAVMGCGQRGGNVQQVQEAPQVETVQPAQTGGSQQRGGGGFNAGTAEERANAQTDRLAELLSLTEEQKTRIRAIELEIQTQLDARRQSLEGNMEALRAAMQEVETVRAERYRAVISAEQLQRYTEDRNQRQRERGQGGGGQRPN